MYWSRQVEAVTAVAGETAVRWAASSAVRAATSIPTPITTPEAMPIKRYPLTGSSPALRSAGPPAPNSRIAAVSTTTRHPSRRVRFVVAAGQFRGKGDVRHLEQAESRRGRQEGQQHADRSGDGTPGGRYGEGEGEEEGSASAPVTMNPRREPVRASWRSDAAPISGSISTSQIFAAVTISPAASAATPRLSVRKYVSTSPGSVRSRRSRASRSRTARSFAEKDGRALVRTEPRCSSRQCSGAMPRDQISESSRSFDSTSAFDGST